MPRRPHARLITGHFDLHDVSFRTEYRIPKPAPHRAQRVPPIGSATREHILCSKKIWQKGRQVYKLTPAAERVAGHEVKLTMVKVRGRDWWRWRVAGIMCSGTCGQ